MKKSSIFCIFIASLILVTGCKKDQDTVTLSAVINQPSKVFINSDRYPCWEGGDAIYINDNSYSINGNSINNSNRTIAEIQGVTVSSNGYYRAIYPASIVPEGSDILNNTVQVNLPSLQVYEGTNVDNQGYQKIRLPMGAYITSGNTLRFSNLCSVIKVSVNNESGTDKVIKEIRIDADNTYLSGAGTATVTTSSSSDIDDDNKITITPTGGKKYVKLARSNGGDMKTITAGNSADFYIVVPEFSTADNITITVTATTGYKKMKFSGVTLNHSSVVTADIDVATLKPLPALLKAGQTFKNLIQGYFASGSNVTKIKFVYNIAAPPTNYTETLSTSDSPTPIYGYISGDTYYVATQADSIMANSDCKEMFRYMLSLREIDFGTQFNTKNTTSIYRMFSLDSELTEIEFPETFYTNSVTNMGNLFDGCTNLETITFPSTFNTSNVQNMASMFARCSSLTTINSLSNFNTANATTMQAMFTECSSLQTLDISSFDISNVQSMMSMFYQCGALSSLTLPSNLNAPALTTMQSMFLGCSNLTSINLTSLTTDGSLTNTQDMFNGCNNLTSLNLSNLNTTQVTNIRAMFKNCKNLGTLTLGYYFEINRNIIQYYGEMFNLTGYDLSGSGGRCTVLCTQSIVDFITDDRAGQVSSTRNNAQADYCTFIADVTAPSTGSK